MYGGGDWASVRGRGIVNLRTGESSGPLGVGCTAEAGMAFRAMSDPVRLFGACTGPDAETRSLAVFTPERTYVWTEPSRLHESVSESGNHEPIILRSSTIDGPTDEILDLRDPARFSLDPPVRFPIFTTPSRQMLAVRATGASTREILLVDLDHASIQPIATYTDCAYEIVEIARTDSRIAIGCEQQPSLGSLTFVHQWAEIVDLERRVRFRTESFPEVLDPVGTDMIVSDRRRLGAESTFTFHTAWRLRLD